MCDFSEVIEARGIDKGIERGIEQGAYKATVETATRLLAMGKFDIEDIAQGTGLTVEQVRELAEKRAS